MALTNCPECGGKVSTLAAACPHCGARRGAGGPPRDPGESTAFAAITLAFWLLAAPVGFVLNLVGIFTGPKRGCFLAMLITFVGLPVLAILAVLLLGGGLPVLQDWLHQLTNGLENRIAAPG